MLVKCSICGVFFRDGLVEPEENINESEHIILQVCNRCYQKWVVEIQNQMKGEQDEGKS